MIDEKWEQLIERTKATAHDVSLSTEPAAEGSGTDDILEFATDAGWFMLVRENRPRLLEKKLHYSHRQGDSAQTEYIFSETELSHKVVVYRANSSGEWEKVNADAGFLGA